MISEVYNEDCMIGMSRYPDGYFQLAICDPPYGINVAKWDTEIPTDEYFKELFRVSKNQIIWGGNYFNLPHKESWICWDKTLKKGGTALGGGQKSEFELAWSNLDIKATIIHFTYDGNIQGFNGGKVDYTFKSIHPTQKPVALYKWLLKRFGSVGDKILDTHLGSASSRIAAHEMGFDFTGFELDKDYFEAAEKRYQNHIKQLNLFPHGR